MSQLAVIIINYNTPDMTERVVNKLLEIERNLASDIIVIDNGSREKINARLAALPGVKLVYNDKNLGFAAAVNQGIKLSEADFILLLNSDVLVETGAISGMLDYLARNKTAAAIGPKMVYPDGKEQISCGCFPTLIREVMRFSWLYKILPGGTYIKDFNNVRQVDWLSGGCLIIRSEALKQTGNFDENYFFGVEDMDLCFRLKKAGWQIVYYPIAKVIHYHGYSSGGKRSARRVAMESDGYDYFFKKNYPDKKISRYAIKYLHSIKIIIFKALGYV